MGIFIRGRHAWDEDVGVNQNVLVHAFQPSVATGGQLAKPTKNGYMIFASDGIFQLFERARGNTFIFLKFSTEHSKKDVEASIALDKISQNVQVGIIVTVLFDLSMNATNVGPLISAKLVGSETQKSRQLRSM